MSATLEPSFVLRGIGVSDEFAQSALRVSIGRYTTGADIETAVIAIINNVRQLRKVTAAV
jgi:cysteine desulfurase